MIPNTLPEHADVAEQLAAMRLGIDASELHGSLCGFLCGGGHAERERWLAQLALDADAHPAAQSPLDRLFLISLEQLNDPEFGFALLLPEDEAPLAARIAGLIDWCRGFLGGFGLSVQSSPPLSSEAAEAFSDMARLAASDPDCDDPDNDETALAELSEFVRIAALLIYSERAPSGPPSSSLLN